MQQIQHYNITVSGHVQGVGFRYSTVRTARSLNIKGFVKNLKNGNVYIEAEATKEKLDKLIEWCYIGPAFSRVNTVNWHLDEYKGFKGFDIKP